MWYNGYLVPELPLEPSEPKLYEPPEWAPIYAEISSREEEEDV